MTLITELEAALKAAKDQAASPEGLRLAAAMAAKSDPVGSLADIPRTKTKPWAHQLRAFWFCWHKLGLSDPEPEGGALLAMDMGTGKTKVAIDVIQNGPIRTVLVCAPLAVVPTWPKEISTHFDGNLPLVTVLGKGPIKKRAATARDAWDRAAERSQVAVFVINHEAVWREPFREFVLSRQWDLLVVDESHRAKSPGGKFSKFLNVLRSRCACRLALTGTPAPRDHMDLYAQGRFIEISCFGSSFVSYQARFGLWREIKTGRKDRRGVPIVVRKLIGVRNPEDLESRLDALAYRVKADDVLDLPPAVVLRRTCELGKEERAIYEELRRELVVQIAGGWVTANNALTKILRLQQIVQGWVKDEDGCMREVGSSKRKLLEDVLETLDGQEPVVVFCRFHSDLDSVRRVCEDLGRGCLELSGRPSGKDGLHAFQSGGGPVLAVQIQAGGVGVDLSRAAYTIYYAPTYDMGAYEQSLRRTRRPTEHKHATFFYYHLVAENTIDVQVYQALKDKKKMADAVLAGIKGK